MKAILKADREVVLDLDPQPRMQINFREDGGIEGYAYSYVDKITGAFYKNTEIEWLEYQGG